MSRTSAGDSFLVDESDPDHVPACATMALHPYDTETHADAQLGIVLGPYSQGGCQAEDDTNRDYVGCDSADRHDAAARTTRGSCITPLGAPKVIAWGGHCVINRDGSEDASLSLLKSASSEARPLALVAAAYIARLLERLELVEPQLVVLLYFSLSFLPLLLF